MKMEFENVYEAPEVLLLLTEVECGFAGSDPLGPGDGGGRVDDGPSIL